MRTLLLSLLLLAACKREEAAALNKEVASLKVQLGVCEVQKKSTDEKYAAAQNELSVAEAELQNTEHNLLLTVRAQVEQKLKPNYLPQLVREILSPESQAITPERLVKDVQPYLGKAWKFTGKILFAQQKEGLTYAVLRQGQSVVYTVGWYKAGFEEGDEVEVMGYIGGVGHHRMKTGEILQMPVLLTSVMLRAGSLDAIASRVGR